MDSDKIISAVQSVTKKWTKQRKQEEREASARTNRRYAMTRSYHVSIREAAWDTMEDAYNKASANGKLPAHARQIMYAARGYIQRTADRPLGQRFDQYFTQTLLPDYMENNSVDWNVVYDARGHFHEPHTEKEVPLGTLQVRDYLNQTSLHYVTDLDFDIWEKRYPTLGPEHRYGAILFIEKEGFMPLFEAVKLAERYDIAIMSTKGMSVTAARALIEQLCADHDIPLFALHDFDKAGFSIVGTLKRSTRRYTFTRNINVVDLGLRLDDIAGLETEDVYTQSSISARSNLRVNGATDEEIEFLLHQRVELNAFASDELIAWIEGKLDEHGVSKIIPDTDTLTDAYRRAVHQTLVQRRIDEVVNELEELGDDIAIPDDLAAAVTTRLKETPVTTWDAVVKDIATERVEGEDE